MGHLAEMVNGRNSSYEYVNECPNLREFTPEPERQKRKQNKKSNCLKQSRNV